MREGFVGLLDLGRLAKHVRHDAGDGGYAVPSSRAAPTNLPAQHRTESLDLPQGQHGDGSLRAPGTVRLGPRAELRGWP